MKKTFVTDLMTSSVLSAPRDKSLAGVVELLVESKVSCIVIMEDYKPVGIITERDTVRFALQDLSFENTKASAVMSAPVCTAKKDMDTFEAYHLLASKKVRHIIIIDDDGNTIGVVTQTDIINNLELGLSKAQMVSNVMTKGIFSASENESLHDALVTMAKKRVSCVLVEEDNRPIGVITERDITRLYKERIDFRSKKTGDVMSRPVISIGVNTPTHEVIRCMREKKIRRIIVIGENGATAGIVTQTDIVNRALEGRYIESLNELIKRKEKMLIGKSAFLECVLNSSREIGIIATDNDFRIVYFNRTAEEIFGYPAREAIRRSIKELCEKEDWGLNDIEKGLEEVNIHGEYLETGEFRKGGEKKILRFRFYSISGTGKNGNDGQGYLLIVGDITESEEAKEKLQTAKEQAEEATRLKDKFVSLVAHDLKAPFSAIIGFLKFILDDTGNPLNPNHHKILQRVVKEAYSLNSLIEELLEISRIKTGRIKPSFRFIDAHFVAQDFGASLKPLADKNA